MTFSGLVRSRQSVRKYSKQPVEADKLGLCVEAVRLAPSASNGQPWRIIVVDEPGLCESVAKACVGPGSNFNRFAIQAPVLVAFVVEKSSAITDILFDFTGTAFADVDRDTSAFANGSEFTGSDNLVPGVAFDLAFLSASAFVFAL